MIYFSGNEIIDNFIKEMHLRIKNDEDIIFEWIPYNQLSNIEEVYKGDLATVYSATWNDGPSHYSSHKKEYHKRKLNKKVALKCMRNSQHITKEFLNEVWNLFIIFLIGFQFSKIVFNNLLFIYSLFIFYRLNHIQLI